MNKVIPWLIGAVVLAGAGGALYYWQHAKAPPPAPIAAAPAPPAPAVEAEQHFPAPVAPASAKPLPDLNASDATVRDDLIGLLGTAAGKYLVPQEIVRHIVVTVDNLPRKHFAWRLSPVLPVGGTFRTAGKGASLVIAPDNAARYTNYVRIAEAINAKKLVLAYGRLYPLFQKAYEDLGYPKGYFNDRLIAVIDHLLAAPEPTGSIALVSPRVQLQFADAGLEALSAGQKILVRIGPANAAVIKAKLREIHRELTGAK